MMIAAAFVSGSLLGVIFGALAAREVHFQNIKESLDESWRHGFDSALIRFRRSGIREWLDEEV
jgi:hypothetical protein